MKVVFPVEYCPNSSTCGIPAASGVRLGSEAHIAGLSAATRACGFPSKSASESSGEKKEPNLNASSSGRTLSLYTARTVRG